MISAMAMFVFITQTNSIAAEYFAKIIRKEGVHKFIIVPDAKAAVKLKPDFVMFTAYDQVKEYDLTKEWNLEIKKNLPLTKIILGGPAFKSRPVAFFWNLSADYALRGEADFTFPLLVRAITKEKPDVEEIKKIPGVMFVQDGRLVMNDQYPCLTRNQLEDLDFSHYCLYEIDMVSVFTERGCPFGCTFCSRVFGKRIRFLSIEKIIQILKEVARNPQVKKVMFANDNMIYNLRRAHKLFGRIIAEGLNKRFTFLINGRIDNFISDDKKYFHHKINLELADLLQQAGVEKISFGTESFNDAEILRLKPEARYTATDAIRLTKVLGQRKITVVHFIIWPSPDALPEEAIESTYKRLVVMDSYSDYIENSAVFANPVKISLIRGSGLYEQALAKKFEVKELNGADQKTVDITKIEEVENRFFNKTGQDVFLPFLTPINRFGTTADPYNNLLLLEEELIDLQSKQQLSKLQAGRLKKLKKNIKICRVQLNKISAKIEKINNNTRLQLKRLLAEIEGVGKFLQAFAQLSATEKRKKLAGFTENFDQASLLGPINVFEADARQIFYMYVVQAMKELVANSKKERQVIRKHKKLTRNMVLNKMLRLRENTPLHIYLYSLKRTLALDRPSAGMLKKHIKSYEARPW